MVGLVDVPEAQPVTLGFSTLHQKVFLDIDLATRSLRGRANIIISPHLRELKSIRLNCRQCRIVQITANGKICSLFEYENPYDQTTLKGRVGVHQHQMLKDRIEGQLKSRPEEELVVTIPKSVRIEEQDQTSAGALSLLLSTIAEGMKNEPSDPIVELSPNTRALIEQSRFTPIALCIEYTIAYIRDGMHFAGWEDEDLRYPHAYTRNSLVPGAACSLFPCSDTITSRCTWDVSIKCHKTIGDALARRQNSSNGLHVTVDGLANGVNGICRSQDSVDGPINFNNEDKALDLVVICSGDMTDEIPHPFDSTRKTTSFQCTTITAPQHIGFAIGPFEHINLADFRESDEDDKLGQNAIPVHGFCLPGRVDEVKNTCLPMAKAIDFFTLTYGSYPFSTYKLCFVDDLIPDIVDTVSLSICSNRLLFPEDIIEPLDQVTRQLVHALATQWMGINVVPKEPADWWVLVGISYFITDIFMKKLSGNNEYRFRQKMASDRVVELDVARPSLSDTGAFISLDRSELEFMALKAPLVLFILDRRLTKASGSSGLSRIISRVFLNAKVGDIANNEMTSSYFTKTCEKLGHTKLEQFFSQWVNGAGCPRFRVTQRFNKKKLVVEMLIQQVQGDLSGERDLEVDTFMRDVKEEIHDVFAGPLQPIFVGPMTIRIHEADGTPYEHIVEIKEATTKFDIPYNTKYKRLKRSRRQKERIVSGVGVDLADGQDDVLLYCLGDVLQTEEDIHDWRLTEWTKEDEERMSDESYEWIRMDADFEWICKMHITMPGYMYLSQLQQDRDVVAQLESVQYMATQRAHPLVSTILLRTLMDRRYFHGIRSTAAASLTIHAREELNWIGLYHLEKAFQEFFCFPNTPMTRSNNFSDRASYNIQCAIPRAIAKVRDNTGRAPFRARSFLLEKLRFNDNTNNEFSDSHYIATLMSALTEAVASKPPPSRDMYTFDMSDDDDGDDLRFHHACLEEIDRYRRMDEWIPSYHNVLSTNAITCQRHLAQANVIPINSFMLLRYTRDGTSDFLRLSAFSNLLELGLLEKDPILRWFFFVLSTDPSPYVRAQLFHLLGKALGTIAIGDNRTSSGPQATEHDGLIIEQESSTTARQADLRRRQTVLGALEALKSELGNRSALKLALWDAVTSPTISLHELGALLEICSLLYDPKYSLPVSLAYPRYWSCIKIGRGRLRFTPGRVRTEIRPKRQIGAPLRGATPAGVRSPQIKRESSGGSVGAGDGAMPPPTRTLLKPPKRPSADGEAPRPKLTLKLNLKKGGV